MQSHGCKWEGLDLNFRAMFPNSLPLGSSRPSFSILSDPKLPFHDIFFLSFFFFLAAP